MATDMEGMILLFCFLLKCVDDCLCYFMTNVTLCNEHNELCKYILNEIYIYNAVGLNMSIMYIYGIL